MIKIKRQCVKEMFINACYALFYTKIANFIEKKTD